MPAENNYTTLEAHLLSRKLVVSCYELTHNLPPDEGANLSKIIRSAAVTVHLNMTQGLLASKKKKRRKLVEATENALIIIDAAIGVLLEVGMADAAATRTIREASSHCFHVLRGLKKDK